MPFLRAALIQKKKAEEREQVSILPPIVVVPEIAEAVDEPVLDDAVDELEILPEPDADELAALSEFNTLLENAIQKVEAQEAAEEAELLPESEDLPEVEPLVEEPEILSEPEAVQEPQADEPEIETLAETETLPEPEELPEQEAEEPEAETLTEPQIDELETEILHEPGQTVEEPDELTEQGTEEPDTESLPELEQLAEEPEIVPENEAPQPESEALPEPEQTADEPQQEPEQDTDSHDELGRVPQEKSEAFANLPPEILAAVTEDNSEPEPEPQPEPESEPELQPAPSGKDYSGETLNYDFTSGERYVDKVSTKTEFDKMLDELSAISKDLLSHEVEKFAVKFTSKFQGDFDKTEADAKKYEAFLGGFITNAAMTLYENGYRDSAVKQLEQAKGIIEASRRLEEETQAIKDRVEEEDATVDLSDILGLFGD